MQLVDFTSSTHAKELRMKDGTRVLFSYGIPVAAYLPAQNTYVRTDQHYSTTSSRHVNEWIGRGVRNAAKVSQDTLDRIGEP